MQLCWEIEDDIYITINGNFRSKKINRTVYEKICEGCNETYLGSHLHTKFCSLLCANNYGMKGTYKRTDEMKEKIRKTIIKREICKGKNNPNWKGGISINPYCSGWEILREELKNMIIMNARILNVKN